MMGQRIRPLLNLIRDGLNGFALLGRPMPLGESASNQSLAKSSANKASVTEGLAGARSGRCRRSRRSRPATQGTTAARSLTWKIVSMRTPSAASN